MALNPIQFLVATNATATTGSNIINVSGNVDCSKVYSGTAISFAGSRTVEAISGTAPDGNGDSTITLRNNWEESTQTNQRLTAFNTIEGLEEAIRRAREIVEQSSAIEDLVGTGVVKKTGTNTYEIVNMTTDGEALITANDVSSQRTLLGLGTSATTDTQTTEYDATVGRVLKVGAFGIGGNTLSPETDFNNLVKGGKYFLNVSVGDNVNAPRDASINWVVDVTTSSNSNNLYQLATRVSTSDESNYEQHLRVRTSGNWRDWVEIFNSGNSVNPAEYGIGQTALPELIDYNAVNESGLYGGTGSGTGLPVESSNVTSLVMSERSTLTHIFSIRSSPTDTLGSRGSIRGYIRGHDASSDDQTVWAELYTEVNLNTKVFGGVNSGDVIAFGTAVNANTVRLHLPILSVSSATGIIVTDPTNFELRSNAGLVLDSGFTIDFSALSSNRVLVLVIDDASGLTAGELVTLRTTSATAKIEVND